jgi:hypothetical protein
MTADVPPEDHNDDEMPSARLLRAHSSRLTDIQTYRLLVRLGRLTQRLSTRCWSTAAATALNAAAQALRGLASALYRANIDDRTDPGT